MKSFSFISKCGFSRAVSGDMSPGLFWEMGLKEFQGEKHFLRAAFAAFLTQTRNGIPNEAEGGGGGGRGGMRGDGVSLTFFVYALHFKVGERIKPLNIPSHLLRAYLTPTRETHMC